MRTTITFDDDLLEKAMKYSGITEKSKLVNEAIRRLVKDELTIRVLALEGSMPDLEYCERGSRMGREPLPRKSTDIADE